MSRNAENVGRILEFSCLCRVVRLISGTAFSMGWELLGEFPLTIIKQPRDFCS